MGLLDNLQDDLENEVYTGLLEAKETEELDFELALESAIAEFETDVDDEFLDNDFIDDEDLDDDFIDDEDLDDEVYESGNSIVDEISSAVDRMSISNDIATENVDLDDLLNDILG